jgi:hypothetical protein
MSENFFVLTQGIDYLCNIIRLRKRLYMFVYDGDGGIMKLTPGKSFHVEPGQVHRFGANESAVEIMEVSTPHLEDVVRLEDDYKR